MASQSPQPIGPAEARRRQLVALELARGLGFVGRVEYRHVYGQSGGAQYGCGAVAGSDLLTVYAEAFDRDANPNDFSLLAIIAHERGHQLLARHARLSVLLASASAAAEEVLASLLGALVLKPGPDRDTLLDKAAYELLSRGATAETAERVIANLWDQLGRLL
jgi:Zn-dependent protease with chaperone function